MPKISRKRKDRLLGKRVFRKGRIDTRRIRGGAAADIPTHMVDPYKRECDAAYMINDTKFISQKITYNLSTTRAYVRQLLRSNLVNLYKLMADELIDAADSNSKTNMREILATGMFNDAAAAGPPIFPPIPPAAPAAAARVAVAAAAAAAANAGNPASLVVGTYIITLIDAYKALVEGPGGQGVPRDPLTAIGACVPAAAPAPAAAADVADTAFNLLCSTMNEIFINNYNLLPVPVKAQPPAQYDPNNYGTMFAEANLAHTAGTTYDAFKALINAKIAAHTDLITAAKLKHGEAQPYPPQAPIPTALDNIVPLIQNPYNELYTIEAFFKQPVIDQHKLYIKKLDASRKFDISYMGVGNYLGNLA